MGAGCLVTRADYNDTVWETQYIELAKVKLDMSRRVQNEGKVLKMHCGRECLNTSLVSMESPFIFVSFIMNLF